MNMLLASVPYGIVKAIGVIALTGILFIISANIIGAVNFELNAKRSFRKYVKLSDKISWVLPKYGGCHASDGIIPYRVYLYTAIFGFINDGVFLLVIILGLLLGCFNLNVFYLLILPVVNLVVASISAIIVIKNIKPDPNPFNRWGT